MGLLQLLSLLSTVVGIASSVSEGGKQDKYAKKTEDYEKQQLALQNAQIKEANKRARRVALANAIGANTPMMPTATPYATRAPSEPSYGKENMWRGISGGVSTLANNQAFGGY